MAHAALGLLSIDACAIVHVVGITPTSEMAMVYGRMVTKHHGVVVGFYGRNTGFYVRRMAGRLDINLGKVSVSAGIIYGW